MNTLSSVSQRRIVSKQAIPSSLHATASPSMMQARERRRASASTISGKRPVRSFAPPAAELHAVAALVGDHAEAVVLDLVQPQLAGGRLRG